MSTALSPHKHELLLLARLAGKSKRSPSPRALGKTLSPYLDCQLSPAEQQALTEQAIDRLVERGQLTRKPLALTDQGRARLRQAFDTDKDLPWSVLRKHYLTARALGIEPTERVRRRIADKDGLRAGILWRGHDLPQAAPPTLTQAVDALVWRQLGIEAEGPLTLAKVRAHFMGQVVQTRRELPLDKLTQLAAAQAARSDGLKPDQLRMSLVQSWLFAEEPTEVPEAPAFKAAEPEPESVDLLATLAQEVRDIAASITDEGRFGDRKVFISAIWARLRERPLAAGMTLESFKAALLRANQADLLRLHRADLVTAMPMEHVRASEVRHLSAAFHLVESVVEPGAALASTSESVPGRFV